MQTAGFLAVSLSLALAAPGFSIDARGLPVYSADGSVDTSRTVADFEPQAPVWRLTQPDTLDASGPSIHVDGQNRVWVSWSSSTGCSARVEGGHAGSASCAEAYFAELDAGGVVGAPVPIIPFDEYSYWNYNVAAGPEEFWCSATILLFEDLHSEAETPTRTAPCQDLDLAATPNIHYLDEDLWGRWRPRLAFLDDEPVIVHFAKYDGIRVLWVLRDREETIPFSGFEYSGSLLKTAPIDREVAILSDARFKFPTTGGLWEHRKYISSLRADSWKTQVFSTDHWGPSWRFEGVNTDEDLPFNYSRALDIGSNGSTRIYVPFIEDRDPEFQGMPDPTNPFGFDRVRIIVPARPKIRVHEASSLDSLAEWTLGYDEVQGTQMAVTNNHAGNYKIIGFLVLRSGTLDLWLFGEQWDSPSWLGPYPIASGVSGSPDIAVDDYNRYWIAWNDGQDVYATMVTLRDLGFTADPYASSVSSPGSTFPRSLALNQNYPNPFNAQTAIQLQSPTAATLEIFNLRGQLLRFIPVSPGSIEATWDGTDSDGRPASSGIYLYRLRSTRQASPVKRMTLVR